MLMVNQLIGFGVAGGATPTLSYRGTTLSTANGSNYTFSSADIGAAAGNRKVIVAAWGDSGAAAPRSHDSLTVGGNASTNVATATFNSGGVACVASLWHIDLAAGDTADIVVSTSGTNQRMAIAVWAAYDLEQSAARDTASSTADPAALDVDVLVGGFAVAAIGMGGASGSATWTGLTERSDAAVEGTDMFSCADASNFASASTLTISGDYSAAGNRRAGVSASWR